MGKGKAKKRAVIKERPKVATIFDCIFCNHRCALFGGPGSGVVASSPPGSSFVFPPPFLRPAALLCSQSVECQIDTKNHIGNISCRVVR